MMFSVLLPMPMAWRSERRSATVQKYIIQTSVAVIALRRSSSKGSLPLTSLIKSPQRRADYDRHLRLKRQQMRRQLRVTIAGCSISALISASLVGVIVPNFVKSVPRGSIFNESLLIKSPAHQLEALAGTTTEGAETAGAASIQIPPSTAVDGLRTAGAAIAPPSAEFDGTRKIETKTANAAEPESIATRSVDATRVVGSSCRRYDCVG
jgi:hypothetical protein